MQFCFAAALFYFTSTLLLLYSKACYAITKPHILQRQKEGQERQEGQARQAGPSQTLFPFKSPFFSPAFNKRCRTAIDISTPCFNLTPRVSFQIPLMNTVTRNGAGAHTTHWQTPHTGSHHTLAHTTHWLTPHTGSHHTLANRPLTSLIYVYAHITRINARAQCTANIYMILLSF